MFKFIPRMKLVNAQQVMYKFHDLEYKIFNHVGRDTMRPLALVAAHDCEDVNKGSLLEMISNVYVMKNIREVFGLSLLEYLDMPMDVVELLNSIADKETSKKASVASDVEQQLRNAKK